MTTFKYHVSCTDGKISVRINLLFYLFFTIVPSNNERPTGNKHITVGWDDVEK